ncbi:MAG: helix-hairpin-helix domain-containing protein [Clostridia bacterium]|nr:helix-hairpin-helix domain-containing protein [Clostridia bacterium]
MKKTGKVILYILLAATAVITVVLSVSRAAEGRNLVLDPADRGVAAAVEATPKIKIYVTGEVVIPGIIEIEKGATILEAVEACGGFTESASHNINLVYKLDKNVTLIIKASDDGGGALVMEDAGDAVLIDNENGLIDGKININNADIASLSLLPGIGEITAADIISYRESTGNFKCIEDLMKVPGIKESKFNKVKELICVN